MYATTGLTRAEIAALCARIVEAHNDGPTAWPPSLGLEASVIVVLTYLRRNRTQAELAEAHGVSQPTISRAVGAMTALIAKVLAETVPRAEDLDPDASYLVDGTLLPTWSWKDRPDLYSGKHKTTGVNVQVACDTRGRLAWVSDPLPGSAHDVAALDASGVLDGMDAGRWVGDRGYQGRDMITPIKKQPGQAELSEHDKSYNRSINSIRAKVERVIANALKTWRSLHTDYRRPIDTIKTTLTAILGLQFWLTP